MKNKIRKIKRELMTLGFMVTILSLVGLYMFAFGIETIHPAIYGMGVIIGSGWFVTGCVS